jgi:hypothetical protein
MIRLIAFDMDGTVLNDEKKILKETKEALEQAARAGIEIVPATGRPFCGISDEIYRLDGVRYVLTTNGAGIYERDSKTCLYEDAIPLSANACRSGGLRCDGRYLFKGWCAYDKEKT